MTIRSKCLVALAVFAAAGCSSAARPSQAPAPAATGSVSPPSADNPYVAKARADSARYPYTRADIDFMTGMIAHHSQAIRMSQLAKSHGASPSIQTLADRIVNAQRDEIRIMQSWLRDRRQPVPDPQAGGMAAMPGMDAMPGMTDDMHHETLMPGMLTEEQMKQLDAARGTDFDRLFLTGMIQHHKGAVSMVQKLFGTYGAAQDEMVFKLASDVNVDQTTEIARMQQMLGMMTILGHAP